MSPYTCWRKPWPWTCLFSNTTCVWFFCYKYTIVLREGLPSYAWEIICVLFYIFSMVLCMIKSVLKPWLMQAWVKVVWGVVLDCSCWQEHSRRWARMTMSSLQGWLCTLPLTSTWNTPARMYAFSSPAASLTSSASLPLRPHTRSRTSWRCERIVLLWIPGAAEALKKCLMAVLVMNDNDPSVCVWGFFLHSNLVMDLSSMTFGKVCWNALRTQDLYVERDVIITFILSQNGCYHIDKKLSTVVIFVFVYLFFKPAERILHVRLNCLFRTLAVVMFGHSIQYCQMTCFWDNYLLLLGVVYSEVLLFLLQEIFMFLIQQLRGLEEPDSPSFKRYFYLLEVSGRSY